jgi:hypothetical protein
MIALVLALALLRADQLADRVGVEYARPGSAVLAANARAAVAVEDALVPAELLLALARTESGFRPNSVSRLVFGRRKTGPWPSDRRPPGATGNFYCGVTQVKGSTWARCIGLRDIGRAYAAAAAELRYWLGRCVRRRLPYACALAGYGAGNAGAARGTSTYARKVLALAARLGWAP